MKDEPFVVTNTIPVQAFCQLRAAVHFQPLTESQAEQVLAHTTAVIAIRHGDRYVGVTRILFDYGTDAYLTDVIVHPDYQRSRHRRPAGEKRPGLPANPRPAGRPDRVQPLRQSRKGTVLCSLRLPAPAQRPIRTRDAAGTVLTSKRPTAETL